MASKEDTQEVIPERANIQTAPEVPHALAKEYGLHKEQVQARAPHAENAVVTNAPAKTADLPDELENPATDAAVDDIVSKESDDLLAMQASVPPEQQIVRRAGRLKRFFRAWWHNKWARYGTLMVFLAGVAALAVVPTTRYAILNTCGVRSSAKVVVLDDTTQLPLKNVSVQIGGRAAQTNREGLAVIHDLKLGSYHLSVKRLAFSSYEQNITIGWGSNPLGSVGLHAVGTQYTLVVKDFLSGKPLVGAEAEASGLNALSDKNGKIILTVADTSVTSLEVNLNAPGYRAERVMLTADSKQTTAVSLLSSQKTAFVSKESGKYDVYSADLDGKNKKLLLAGTGLENSTISLAISPDNSQAALVSTRDNIRDSDNYLLYALTFINLSDGTSVTVDHAQQLQLVDWIGNKLIYRSTVAGASAANSGRNRLLAYNYQTNARLQLATANQFNTVLSAGGSIYYSVSSNDPSATLGLFRVRPDGSNRERLSDHEVWTALRTSVEALTLQTPEGWLNFDLTTKKMTAGTPPAEFASKMFVSDPTGTRTAWADVRDGKGALLFKTTASDQVNTLVIQAGLTSPLRWVSSTTIIYRVVTSNESADYVLSADGGPAHKISDVTATYSYIQAY